MKYGDTRFLFDSDESLLFPLQSVLCLHFHTIRLHLQTIKLHIQTIRLNIQIITLHIQTIQSVDSIYKSRAAHQS